MLVAVMVTNDDGGIVDGAVKSPDELIVPAVAVQVTGISAVNCSVWPGTSVAATGWRLIGFARAIVVESAAVLLTVLVSPPPATTTKFVTSVGALPATFTLIVIGG